MKNLKLFNSTETDDALQHSVDLYVKAMMMVSSEYGASLSHEEFMDKAEELFCELLEEEENGNGIAIC